jgi:hypothetical protein
MEFDNLGELIRDIAHDPQPHTILGERGQNIVILKDIQICECFMRGFLLGATDYRNIGSKTENSLPPEKLGYHQLVDLLYSPDITWVIDFDPMAVIQSGSCEMEKVLGIYPNVHPIEKQEFGKGEK